MIRDRFALAIMGVTVGFFTTLAAVANLEEVPRNIDIVVLWLAGAAAAGAAPGVGVHPASAALDRGRLGPHPRRDGCWRDHHCAHPGRGIGRSLGAGWPRDRRDRDDDHVRSSLARGVVAGALTAVRQRHRVRRGEWLSSAAYEEEDRREITDTISASAGRAAAGRMQWPGGQPAAQPRAIQRAERRARAARNSDGRARNRQCSRNGQCGSDRHCRPQQERRRQQPPRP